MNLPNLLVTQMENRTEFRNHPIIMLKGIGGVIAFLVVIGMRNIKELMDIKFNQDTYAEISKNTTPILIGFLALIGVCALVVAAQYFKWKNTKIFLDKEHIYYEYTGFFKRINKQVSFKNVSSVNTRATIFDKIFNISEIQLDINSAETANQADYKIILSTKKAEQFKQMVDTAKTETTIKKSMMQEQVSPEENVDDAKDVVEYTFSTLQCLRHVFLNVSLLTIIWFLGIMIFSFISAFKLDNWVGAITALVIGIGPAIVDFGKSIARFMNFKTARKGNSIYLNYGFLSTQNYIIPVKNIVSVGITQSFSAKLVGYECIEVNTIGIGNEKNELSVLSIYMKKEDARTFADKIIPEFSLVHDFAMQPHKVFIYKSIVNVIAMEVICLGLVYILGYWWITVIGLIIGLFMAFIGYASYGLKIMDDYIVLKTGVFAIKTKTIKFNRIDQMVLEQNMIHRAIGLEKLELKSRGKLGKETSKTGYYRVGTFSETVADFRNYCV